MQTYWAKVKHLLPAFLLVTWGTTIGFGLARWLLETRFPGLHIKEEVWDVWLPLILPWIPILLWLRPRFWVLTFKKDASNGQFFFQIIAWGTMIAMLWTSQEYLASATATLTELPGVEEIEQKKDSRYYKLADFAVAPDYRGSYTDFRPSGKNGRDLNFTVYFVVPFLRSNPVPADSVPKYWYGIKYSKQISNRIGTEEKMAAYEAFYAECGKKMDDYAFDRPDHFERKPWSDDRENYLRAIGARTGQAADDHFIILTPVMEKYEDRTGNKLAWIFGSFGIGTLVLLLLLIRPGYDEQERKRFLSGKKPKDDELIDSLRYLIPRGDHFVTSILVDLNLLVFLAMIFSGVHILFPNGRELLEWGGNRRTETMGGEWWRLFTNLFLHGGLPHLVLNITGLALAAIFVEPLLGRAKYCTVYLLSGLGAGLSSIWWHPHTVSAGASGAIFGLYGALLAILLLKSPGEGGKKGILVFVGVYIGINLLWGLSGGIDNAAHLGGLLSGALHGMILYRPVRGDDDRRRTK